MWKAITTLMDVHVECCQFILLIYSLLFKYFKKTHIFRRDIWALMDAHCDFTLYPSIMTHDKERQ